MILSLIILSTTDMRYPTGPTDKILKRLNELTTKMHPFKQQYLPGAVKLNRRPVMRH